MNARYCLDTSVFIEGWHRVWPPDLIPEFWDRLANLIDNGIAVIPRPVITEDLEKKDDEILRWVRRRNPDSIIDELPEVQKCVSKILGEFRTFVHPRKGRNASDPWVIAVAYTYDLVVVTQEVRPGSETKPSIPFVCRHYSVPYTDIHGLCRQEGWRFGVQQAS